MTEVPQCLFVRLPELCVLQIRATPSLQSLPKSMCRSTSLVSFEATGTPRLQELPGCIGQMSALVKLDLRDSGITHLPSSIVYLPLEFLSVQGSALCKTAWSTSDEAAAAMLRDFSTREVPSQPENFMGCSTKGFCAPHCPQY